MAQKLKPGSYEAKLRVKKGDEVEVIAGKDRGKRGKIIQAIPKENKVVVEGVNLMTKHQKARPTGKQGPGGAQQMTEGGRIQKPAPLYVPKVMLVCPNCNRPTRVGYRYREGDEKLSSRKFRHCKHPDCDKEIG
jgi:large subunit ribosomal protein L24